MIEWNDENKKILLDCVDVQDMMRKFPGVKGESLRRKYNEFKHHVIGSSADISVEKDILKRQYESSKKQVNDKYKNLLDKIDTLTQERNAAIALSETKQGIIIEPKLGESKSESIAVIVASDWHIDEIVNSKSINGLNEFNPTIADGRVHKFFRNAARMVKLFQNDTDISTIILELLGDFISGNIHEELLENTSMRPMDAIIKATEYLIGGINFFLEQTKCKLVIVCHSGNHPRITRKLHVSSEAGNSLEYLMYHNLKLHFANEKRIEFIISEGYHSYINVFGKTIRSHHGHEIKYGGGIGGLSIPLMKATQAWNKGRLADLDILGHFHQQRDYGNQITNGSLIGYNAFALSIKADYEEPKQTFLLLHKKHFKTVVAPIWLE
jgi:hypothetical protein